MCKNGAVGSANKRLGKVKLFVVKVKLFVVDNVGNLYIGLHKCFIWTCDPSFHDTS